MRTIKYEPDVEGFSGYVELKVPKYSQRLRLLGKMGVKVSPDGTVEQAGDDSIEKMADLVDELEQYVEEVRLKFGTKKIESYEDLQFYQEGAAIINGLINAIAQGISLSKN